MKEFLTLFFSLVQCFVMGCASQQPTEPVVGQWVSIFNGQDMEGWTPKVKGYKLGENPGDIFRVEDGKLVVSYDQFERFDGLFGHIFYKDNFSHYRLRMEYRFIGDQTPGGPGWAFRNNGVMVHGQDPQTMRIDQEFPVSIEVQLLGGDGTNPRPTGNLCTPGTNVVLNGKLSTAHCVNSSSSTFHGDQWVTIELEVNGSGIIKHIINGEVVLQYEQPQLDARDADAKKIIESMNGQLLLSGGSISLQAESHQTEFRNIEIMLLEEN